MEEEREKSGEGRVCTSFTEEEDVVMKLGWLLSAPSQNYLARLRILPWGDNGTSHTSMSAYCEHTSFKTGLYSVSYLQMGVLVILSALILIQNEATDGLNTKIQNDQYLLGMFDLKRGQ